MKGPAINIFKKKLGNIKRLQEKNVKDIQFQKIFTTTSWESNIEKIYQLWFDEKNSNILFFGPLE